jgi:hypothetical protein
MLRLTVLQHSDGGRRSGRQNGTFFNDSSSQCLLGDGVVVLADAILIVRGLSAWTAVVVADVAVIVATPFMPEGASIVSIWAPVVTHHVFASH